MKLILGDCLEKLKELEGFDFIGIEREPDYMKIAEARINAYKPENKLL